MSKSDVVQTFKGKVVPAVTSVCKSCVLFWTSACIARGHRLPGCSFKVFICPTSNDRGGEERSRGWDCAGDASIEPGLTGFKARWRHCSSTSRCCCSMRASACSNLGSRGCLYQGSSLIPSMVMRSFSLTLKILSSSSFTPSDSCMPHSLQVSVALAEESCHGILNA